MSLLRSGDLHRKSRVMLLSVSNSTVLEQTGDESAARRGICRAEVHVSWYSIVLKAKHFPRSAAGRFSFDESPAPWLPETKAPHYRIAALRKYQHYKAHRKQIAPGDRNPLTASSDIY